MFFNIEHEIKLLKERHEEHTKELNQLREDLQLSITATEQALAAATATINAQGETLQIIDTEINNVVTILTDLQTSTVDPDQALASAIASLNTAIQANGALESNIQTAVAAAVPANTTTTNEVSNPNEVAVNATSTDLPYTSASTIKNASLLNNAVTEIVIPEDTTGVVTSAS